MNNPFANVFELLKSVADKTRKAWQNNAWYKSLLKLTLILFVAGIATIAAFYWSIYFGLFGPIPTAQELENIKNPVASEVYSSDSVLLGKYYLQERTDVTFDQLPEELIQALLATEDVRFYEHSGVDKRSLFRVLFKSIILRDESSGGGSTITQQLAKNIFPRQRNRYLSTPINKLKEIIIAQKLEKIYSKEDILTLYFNTVSFGENAFGIRTASERFFSVRPKQLKIQEAAVLVGLLKATNTYNPRLNPNNSISRRNLVISQMAKYRFLAKDESDSIKSLPLVLRYKQHNHNEGLATYFREHIRRELNEWCRQNQKADGTHYNLYTDGLKIYTTLHAGMQRYAEKAVQTHMAELQNTFYRHWGKSEPWTTHSQILMNAKYKSARYKKWREEGLPEEDINKKFSAPIRMKIFTWEGEVEKEMSPLDSIKHYLYFLHAGFMVMEPRSGHILAWVGGINHKYFKFDHVNVNTKRQVGSTFKPIVYATALENGVEPCDFVPARRIIYKNFEDWSPGNANDKYEGSYSVKGALTHSVNTVSVKVLKRATIDKTVTLASEMGIESEIPPVPSIALGTANISLHEMVGAFATFANRGKVRKPNFLLGITGRDGKVLESFQNTEEEKRVMSTQTADMMTAMMRNVVNNGTASRLRTKYGLKNDIAGKTGTTQSHADGWFIGFTPDLVAGAWVGSDDPNIHFRSITYGQGASMALPIWALFMQQVNKDKALSHYAKAGFRHAGGEVSRLMNCDDYRDRKSFIDDIFAKILKKRDRSKPKRSKRKQPRKRRWTN